MGKRLILALHSYLTREWAKECMSVIIHKSHNVMQFQNRRLVSGQKYRLGIGQNWMASLMRDLALQDRKI